MSEIKVMVKPVFEVISDGCFDEKESMSERVSVKHCYSCGSPLMYTRQEKDYEGKKGQSDYTWYCAVCGSCQGGIMIDCTKGES
jgi:NAD(P)H-flavin reductase